MKKSRKQKYVLILLLALLLGLVVGYAAFSDVLTISGRATAQGTFDIQFSEASVVTSAGVTSATCNIDHDSNQLNVQVSGLSYPGAGVQFHTVIENVGDLPAEISSVSLTPDPLTAPIIVTGLDVLNDSHEELVSGGTCSLDFTVQWDPSYTASLDDELTVDFSLTVNYVQSTQLDTFTGTSSHIDA